MLILLRNIALSPKWYIGHTFRRFARIGDLNMLQGNVFDTIAWNTANRNRVDIMEIVYLWSS